uniref:Uncharacterized protein n=2 Tax=Graphocephala atropunctata TaxID=36148 RepID=A0A1B6M653_9HEMI
MEEVIDEVVINPYQYHFCSEFSEEIQYHYKLKYPEVYSLAPNTVMNMLDDAMIYSKLEGSVASYIGRVRQSLETSKNLGLILRGNDFAMGRYKYQSTAEEQSCDDMRRKLDAMAPAGASVYDSVHSVKVRNKTRNRPTLQHQRKGETGRDHHYHSSSTDVPLQLNGLVDKAVPFPLWCNKRSAGNHLGRKDRGITLTPYKKPQPRNIYITKKK